MTAIRKTKEAQRRDFEKINKKLKNNDEIINILSNLITFHI